MPQISIKLDDRQVIKQINHLSTGLKGYKKPLDEAGDDLLRYYGEDVFKSQGKALGGKWKPLSAATLKLRKERRMHYANQPRTTGKILIWTGKLQDSFRKKARRTKLVIDNTANYFKFHQKKGKGQRSMLAINKTVINIVLKRVDAYIKDLIK